MSEHDLEVEVDGDLIVVSQLETQFVAIYARPRMMPQLILRKRSEGEDYELFARAGRQQTTRRATFGADCRVRERYSPRVQRDGINKAKAAGTRF